MSETERKLKADLTRTAQELSERTRERDDVQLRLVESTSALAATKLELVESDKRLTSTKLELVASEKELRTTQNQLAESSHALELSEHSSILREALLGTRDLELAQQTAQLASAAFELSNRTAQLAEANSFLLSRTEQLEHANSELKRMMQQREDFVAALTHDLKSPLLGSTRMLEMLIAGNIDADTQPVVFKQMLMVNQAMLRMIRNLLDTYRHDSGSLNPAREDIELERMLSNCVDEFFHSTADKKIELTLSISPEKIRIHSDPILLRRVIVNLIDNAVKFTPVGGRISVCVRENDGKVEIQIADSGHGMSEEQRQRVFQRFWQTPKGRESGIGTGLGLFVSYQIVQALQGEIECISAEGKGTQFIVRFPR
jgi:signal transduction histidine kinase